MPFSPYRPGCCGGSGWMMAGGWIAMLVFWALVIAGIVALVRVLRNGSAGGQRTDSATETLRRRYAAGEISKEQFEEMKRTLG